LVGFTLSRSGIFQKDSAEFIGHFIHNNIRIKEYKVAAINKQKKENGN
jgi:hypothetical protein